MAEKSEEVRKPHILWYKLSERKPPYEDEYLVYDPTQRYPFAVQVWLAEYQHFTFVNPTHWAFLTKPKMTGIIGWS